MGIVTENVTFRTSFDFDHDWSLLKDKVKTARLMLSRRYLFIGETHNSPIDKKRTVRVAEKFAGTGGPVSDDVILVAERAIFDDQDGLEYLGFRTNFIHEENRSASPFAQVRNVEIVEQVIAETARDAVHRPHRSPRPVVFLFGESHEEPIRRELARQLPINEKICWWFFPSLQSQLDALPTPPTPAAATFIGFCSPPAEDPGANFQLCMKGRLSGPLTLRVDPGFGMLSFRRGLYALFGTPPLPNIGLGQNLRIEGPGFQIAPVDDTLFGVLMNQVDARR